MTYSRLSLTPTMIFEIKCCLPLSILLDNETSNYWTSVANTEKQLHQYTSTLANTSVSFVHYFKFQVCTIRV